MLGGSFGATAAKFSVGLLAAVVAGLMLGGHATAQQPAPADLFGEEVTLEARPIVFVAGTATWDSAFATLTEKFKALAAFLAQQKLKAAGPVMTIYTTVTDKGFEFYAAAPLAQPPASPPSGTIRAGESPAGKALKFVYRGSYDAMDVLYEAITHYLDEKKIERQGLFFEEYVTDPLATPEDKLEINVFVLVR